MSTSVILLLSSLIIIPIQSCTIHGTESGICTYRYLPSTYQDDTRSKLEAIEMANQNWANETDGPCKNGEADHCMPFCGRYIASYYPPCVPNPGVALERDQNFPNGRFQDHTTRAKDRWVEEQVMYIIENRVEMERKKESKKRFYKNKSCQDAYKRYFCWVNFPRCDEFEETLPMCQSACQNFFRVCGYEEDLWMCDNIIDNVQEIGSKTKTSDKDEGRPYFPGEPFKKNEYERRKVPKEICTPSIRGDASSIQMLKIVSFTTVIATVQFFIL